MTRAEAVRSVEAGIEIVDILVQEETVDMLGPADMGIGNTAPSTAISAAVSGIPVDKLTGRRTGIDAALDKKISVIKWYSACT